jgi:hypothetical protein
VNQNSHRGAKPKPNSGVYEPIGDKSNTGGICNTEFSISSNKILNSQQNTNFEKNYKKVLNDFYSLGYESVSQFRNLSVDFDDKLKLKALQSQLKEQKTVNHNKKDFSSKIKEIKLDLFTKSSNEYYNYKKTTNSKSNRSETTYFMSQNNINNSFTENKLIKNELIPDKLKMKMVDCFKKANDFNENGAGRVNLNQLSKLSTIDLNTKPDMKENILLNLDNLTSKFKKVSNSNYSNNYSNRNNLQSKKTGNLFTVVSSPRQAKKSEFSKKQFANLLYGDDMERGNNIAKWKLINSDHGKNNNKFNLSYNTSSTNSYLRTGTIYNILLYR